MGSSIRTSRWSSRGEVHTVKRKSDRRRASFQTPRFCHMLSNHRSQISLHDTTYHILCRIHPMEHNHAGVEGSILNNKHQASKTSFSRNSSAAYFETIPRGNKSQARDIRRFVCYMWSNSSDEVVTEMDIVDVFFLQEAGISNAEIGKYLNFRSSGQLDWLSSKSSWNMT